MRQRTLLSLTAVLLISSVTAAPEEPQAMAVESPQSVEWNYSPGRAFGSPLVYAQGWASYGYGSPYFRSHYQTPHFPYLYFYEQYTREAEESSRAADEYEASLAREDKLTGPLEVGAFTTDVLPRPPLDVPLTLDGEAVMPSPSGAPLVIESGAHTLQIGAPANSREN